MFESLDTRNRIGPRPWHSWIAAIMAIGMLAILVQYALHRAAWLTDSIGGYILLAFLSLEGTVIVIAWVLSLSGRIRAYTAYLIAMACFATLSAVNLLLTSP